MIYSNFETGRGPCTDNLQIKHNIKCINKIYASLNKRTQNA